MINWERIEELIGEIGQDEFPEVAELFFEEMDEALAKLAQQTDADEIADSLHFLKGSALNLGFDGFGAMCQLPGQLPPDGGPLIDMGRLRAVYDLSLTEFRRGLDSDQMVA